MLCKKLGKDNRIIVEQKILCMDIPKHREILYKNRDCCYDFHHYATAPLFCLSYNKKNCSINYDRAVFCVKKTNFMSFSNKIMDDLYNYITLI